MESRPDIRAVKKVATSRKDRMRTIFLEEDTTFTLNACTVVNVSAHLGHGFSKQAFMEVIGLPCHINV